MVSDTGETPEVPQDNRTDEAPPARRAVSRPTLIGIVGFVVVIAIAAIVWPAGSSAPVNAAPAVTTLTINRDDCGSGWSDPHGGAQTIDVTNTDINPSEADLVQTSTGEVIAEVDGVAPNTTAALRVVLGDGSYALRCLIDDVDPITGPPVTITGSNAQTNPGAQPVTTADLLAPLKAYGAYLIAGVGTLATQTDALDAAVHSGDLDNARAAWLPAHLTYETLGAAYDAFGDFDGEINGTTAGLPGGVNDPNFTGFHRLEYGLWHGQTAAALTPVADELDSDVHGLQQAMPTIETGALDIGLRAHEIMENALQFELTAQNDYGSGTDLATIAANLTGDEEVITLLRPILQPRYPGLSQVDEWSNRLSTLLQAQHHADGSWTPVQQLSQTDREKLDGTLSELVEVLAPVATICEPRRVQ